MENFYQISTGGRVKAAGLSYSMFFDPARQYIEQPGIKTAKELISTYTGLRKSPSDEIRNRFFPRSSETSGMIRTGAALPRTSITTHQGVGQFLTHQVGKEGQTEIKIKRQTGFAILESHLEEQLRIFNYPTMLLGLIDSVKAHFSQNDLRAAQLAYEQLALECHLLGIKVQRQANVGREGLFFIHPSLPESPVRIDQTTYNEIVLRASRIPEQLARAAEIKRSQMADILGVKPKTKKISYLPLYFQTDFLVQKNSQIQVSDINLPDVGFFLTVINPEDNETVLKARQTMEPYLESIASSIIKKATLHNSKTIRLITRKSVIENLEDTLEIKELLAISSALKEFGIEVQTSSLEESLNMDNDVLGILMNIDIQSQAFNQLILSRLRDESVPIYPDPFLLLAKNELTDHRQVLLNSENIKCLNEVFLSLEKASNPGKEYVLLAALDQIFRDLGIDETDMVFHMYIPGQSTPIPFFRYDARGLQIALNYAKNVDSAVIRSIPITLDNAILYDEDQQPVYSVLRYLFYS